MHNYTECYGQTLYGILDISTTKFGKLLNISRSVDIPTLKTYIFVAQMVYRYMAGHWPQG